MIRFLTAGESHGRALVVILEGIPAGLALDFNAIDHELKRRQGGYGRGRRMAIESDRAEILSGVRRGETIGGPIARTIQNGDWTIWQHTMRLEGDPPQDAGGAHRGRVTRILPGSRSTTAATSVTSSSARARVRPRRAWLRAPSRDSCSRLPASV